MMQEFWQTNQMLKQLGEINRVMTVNGPLMLNVLHDEIYELKRARQLEYGPEVVIDCFASRSTKLLLRSAMHDWYQNNYGLKQTHSIDPAWETFERYNIPDRSTMFAVFEKNMERDHVLWFIDIANTTENWDIIEPNRHLAIVGFSGFGFKD